MRKPILLIALVLALAGCSSSTNSAENRLVFDPNEKLRGVSAVVNTFTQNDRKNLDDMKEILAEDHPTSAGIAAPQIGVNRRYIVIRDFKSEKLIEMINPQIVKSEGNQKHLEGCISILGVYGVVNRAKMITVEYEDRKGKKNTMKAEGLLSASVQHEIDHLNGVLFYDVASDVFSRED